MKTIKKLKSRLVGVIIAVFMLIGFVPTKTYAAPGVTIPDQVAVVGNDVYIPWPQGVDRYKLHEMGVTVSLITGTTQLYPSGMFIPQQASPIKKTFYVSVHYPQGDQWVDSNTFTVTWEEETYPITSVQIDNVRMPTVGLSCSLESMTIVTDPANTVSVVERYWYDSTAGRETSDTDTFIEGHWYTLYITLEQNGAYYVFPFDEDSGEDAVPYAGTVTINGQDAAYAEQSSESDISLCIATADIEAVVPVNIDRVEIVNAPKPVVGQSSTISGVVVNTNPVNATTIRETYWYDGTIKKRVPAGDPFIEGHDYQFTITLEPKSGYAFLFNSSEPSKPFAGTVTVNNEAPYLAENYFWSPSGLFVSANFITATSATPATNVTFPSNNVYLAVGESGDLGLITTPADASRNDLVWSYSDSKIANGIDGPTAKKVGKTIVTVTTPDGTKSATCTLNVEFTDVRKADNKNFYSKVYWAVEKNITVGYKDSDGLYRQFRPYDICTRGQMVMFLWKMMGQPASSGTNPFNDISGTGNTMKSVTWAYERGVTIGVTNADGSKSFLPDDDCTRRDAVMFLWKLAGKPNCKDVVLPFTDVNDSTPGVSAIKWAYKNKITIGYTEADGSKTFRPDKTCQRWEIVTFMYKFAQQYLH